MTDQTDVHDPATSAAIDEINALAPSMAIPVSGVAAATSGVLAAGVALGVGELLSGISNKIPSLIIRVGDVVIENSPGSVERWAIDTLGTNDKPALIVGITLISLLLGGLTGIAASKKFTAGVTIFVLFGLLGGLAAGSDPQRPAGWAWFSAILAAAAGTAAHYVPYYHTTILPYYRVGTTPTIPPCWHRFLTTGALLLTTHELPPAPHCLLLTN